MRAAERTKISAARTLTYDANGNLTNDGNGKVYAYDAANRMVSCTQTVNGVQTVTGFVYDGWGHRVQETSNGSIVKQWVWCPGDYQPCEERDGSNNVTKRFYALGEQINGTSFYFTGDHLGSTREMTDSTGAIRARYDYDPYGRTTKLQGDLDADFRYTGFYYDQATSLYFSMSRPYDPNLARWLSRDPVQEAGGINLYDYVGNNPINAVDPLGWCSPKCIKAQLEFDAAINDLVKDFVNYNPIKDLIGGWASRRSPTLTVPGGHAQQIQGKMNRVARAIRRIEQDCKDDYGPPPPVPANNPQQQPQPIPAQLSRVYDLPLGVTIFVHSGSIDVFGLNPGGMRITAPPIFTGASAEAAAEAAFAAP